MGNTGLGAASMRLPRFLLLGLIGFVCMAGQSFAAEPSLPAGIPILERGGMIKFPSQLAIDPAGHADYFDWVKRFQFCLVRTPRYFEEPFLSEAREAGCRLFIRLPFGRVNVGETPGATGDEISSSRGRAYAEILAHPEWLLNPDDPVRRRPDAPPAHFFDFNNADFRRFHADWLKRRLDETGYNGIYFDIMGEYGVPDEVMALWRKRYPNESYDAAGARFVSELREAIGKKLIGGNMAYRGWRHYFPHIDYSHKESNGTSHRGAEPVRVYLEGAGWRDVRETVYRQWDGPGGYKELNTPRREAEKNYPDVFTCDLNYIFPRCVETGTVRQVDGRTVRVYRQVIDRPAIHYGYALAKLSDRGSYACDVSSRTIDTIERWTPDFVRDDVYFVDLGPPLEDDYRERDEVVIRYFRNGFVAVTRHNRRAEFTVHANMIPKGAIGLWDLFERKEVDDWHLKRSLAIEPTHYPATGIDNPGGRVYLYLGKMAR